MGRKQISGLVSSMRFVLWISIGQMYNYQQFDWPIFSLLTFPICRISRSHTPWFFLSCTASVSARLEWQTCSVHYCLASGRAVQSVVDLNHWLLRIINHGKGSEWQRCVPVSCWIIIIFLKYLSTSSLHYTHSPWVISQWSTVRKSCISHQPLLLVDAVG